MKAAVLTVPNRIEIIDRATPKPGKGEVQVKVHSVAVCGTDVHIFQGYSIGTFHPKLPLILGHEVSGAVSAVGEGVKNIKEGERCVVEANIGCGECALCRKGSYCFCNDVQVVSIHRDGAFAEYMVVPSDKAYPIPDSLGWEKASLTEPLAMTMLTFLDCPVAQGDYVAVLGCGMGGFGLTALARMAGAKKVIMTGTRDERLAVGKKVGADVVINVGREDAIKRIMDETECRGADVVYEAAGVVETFLQAIKVAAKTGKIGIYGIPVKPVDGFDAGEFLLKALKLISASGSPRAFPDAISVSSSGKVDLSPVITHRFKFEEIQKAMEVVRDRKGGVIKAIVRIGL
jgi:L-iditol 2-dehydrogenase